MPVDPYAILLRDGKKVDALTDGALKRAEKILGRTIPIVQGSYNAGGVAASAGTHDGGGCIDTKPWDHEEVVAALRAVGFAAWFRPTVPDLWSAHVHAVLIGHDRLAPVAARQVQAYLARRDGLVSNAIDTQPGWTNTARYTVESFKADAARDRITKNIASKRDQIVTKQEERAAKKRRIAELRAKVKALLAKMAGLPK